MDFNKSGSQVLGDGRGRVVVREEGVWECPECGHTERGVR